MMNKTRNEENDYVLRAIVVLLLVCALLVGGGGYYLVSNNIIPLGHNQNENAYVDAGEISTKLQDEGKTRYIKCRVYVGYDKNNKNYEEQLTKQKQISIASEVINSYFRNKTYDYLNDLNNIDTIKSEIKDEVNSQLQSCKIKDVRFFEYVLK